MCQSISTVSRIYARPQPKLMYRTFRYVSPSSGFNYKNRASLEHLPPLMPSPVRVRPLIVVNWSPAYEPVKARQHWLILIPPLLEDPPRPSYVLAIVAKFITRRGNKKWRSRYDQKKLHCKKILCKITPIIVGNFETHYNRCKFSRVCKFIVCK